MAVDLGQLLGGVLAGVAEARSLGDRYSRGLALLYERDDLLRAFPVPRAELGSVEVQLSFAIESTIATQIPEVTALVDRTRAAIVAVVSDALRQAKVRRTSSDVDKLIGDAVRRELTAPTLVAAATSPPVRVESFDIDRMTLVVLDVLKNFKAAQRGGPLEETLKVELPPVRDAHAAGLEDLRVQGLFVGSSLEVRATYGELADLPAVAVSSVKLTINVRNYEWTQTDVVDREPVRKLVPE